MAMLVKSAALILAVSAILIMPDDVYKGMAFMGLSVLMSIESLVREIRDKQD